MREYADILQTIEARVEARLSGWPAEWTRFTWPGYTYEHTLRVRNLSLAMARQLGADERIVELAALLHDIGKPDGEPHGVAGARRAEPILAELGVDAHSRGRICHIIENHLICDPSHPVENLALYDADFLDANYGYIAFTRYTTVRGHRGATASEIAASAPEWLVRVAERGTKIRTDLGHAIAAERYQRMQAHCRVLGDDLGAGDGPALGLACYLVADAQHPSLSRQVRELEGILDGEDPSADVAPSDYLREFVRLLQEEIAGKR